MPRGPAGNATPRASRAPSESASVTGTRVTVIATGIGNSTEEKEPAEIADPTYGGKVRDITPADLAIGDELDEPTFQRVKRQKAANESTGSIYKGYKDMVIDHNDLDVPTFLRRKAD